jgi:hypothetical protein
MFNWYDDPSDWDVYLAATGPSNWKTVPYGQTGPPVTPEPSTQVSDVVEHNASIDFNVSRIGVPIAVTISYYPNWQVSGAEGPYRVSPNLMVVVPTSHHVHMWYGETPVDYSGWALTILALVGLVVLVRRPQAAVGALAATSGQALGQSSWTPVAAGGWGAGSYGYGPPPGSQGSGAPPDGPSGQPAPDVPPGSEQPEAPAQGPPAQDADQPAPDKVVDQPAPPGPEPWRPHYEPAIYQPATYEPARAVPPSELVAADEPTGPVTAAEPSVADGPSAIARGGPDPDSGAEQRGEA